MEFRYQALVWLEWCRYNNLCISINLDSYSINFMIFNYKESVIAKLQEQATDKWNITLREGDLYLVFLNKVKSNREITGVPNANELYEEAIVDALAYINETINKIPF